ARRALYVYSLSLHDALPIYGPAHRDVDLEQFGQLGGGARRCGVAPGAEWHAQLVIGAAGQVAVHHGRDSQGGQRRQLAAVGLTGPVAPTGAGRCRAAPRLGDAVRPVSVAPPVLPFGASGGQADSVRGDEAGLDPCGSEFDAEHGRSGLDDLRRFRAGPATRCVLWFHVPGSLRLRVRGAGSIARRMLALTFMYS